MLAKKEHKSACHEDEKILNAKMTGQLKDPPAPTHETNDGGNAGKYSDVKQKAVEHFS